MYARGIYKLHTYMCLGCLWYPHRDACLWKDVYWMWYILLAMFVGLVRIFSYEFFRQSRELLVVGWNIFLWVVLSFIFSRALYFVMVIL